ncbi:MAG: DUF222 domain-containing protein [Acidimicrobiaceae bacterium]|nr:DUF222 domain-containing protein [Acidimicrobiaceae bacterium]
MASSGDSASGDGSASAVWAGGLAANGLAAGGSAAGGLAAGGLAAGGASAGEVRVDAVDVAKLCGQGLRARLGEIARAESRLAVMKADTLGEIAHRDGDGAAASAATDEMAVSGRRARGEVRDAVRLGSLEATRQGLAGGSVRVGHAQLIARAAGDAPIDEEFLAGRAPLEGYDAFRRTVARHVAEVSRDDGASVLERQRQARSGKVVTRQSDGMTVLHLAVDPITGARLGTVVAAAERRLFKHEDPAARRTPPQRAADAITQLILEPDAKRPSGASLIVVADYDTLNHQLANGRLADGTPIPISEIARIAVDAEVLPAVFEAATGDLRIGRSRRTATELQRAALALRDRGCVGCGIPPERCQHHHIDHWQHGGHTDYGNLLTVCHHCHNHKIHLQGFTAHWHPGRPTVPGQPATPGRYELEPPKPDPPASGASSPANHRTSNITGSATSSSASNRADRPRNSNSNSRSGSNSNNRANSNSNSRSEPRAPPR